MVIFLVVHYNYTSGVAQLIISHVLKECHRSRILEQPDAEQKKLYTKQCGLVIS